MSIITIVGAGMMGAAMAFPARENGHEVHLVGTHLDRDIIEEAKKTGYHNTLKHQLPEGVKCYQIEELQQALDNADLLVGGVSSFGVDWFADNILCVIPDTLPVLNITKGLIHMGDGKLISYPEYYAQKLGEKKLSLNAVGGPCISFELASHDPTSISFCGEDIELLRSIKELFKTSYYHISLSIDVRGVEFAVALKNAYALGVTLAIGLSQKRDGQDHYNSQAALFGQSVKEMSRILELYGCGSQNVYLAAGDLYVTVFGGRTRKIGTLLGSGYSFDDAVAELKGVTLESIVIAQRTADAISALALQGKVKREEFPLLMHIDNIMKGAPAGEIPWDAFETEML